MKPRIQSYPAVQVEVSTDHPEEGGGKGDEQLQQHEEHQRQPCPTFQVYITFKFIEGIFEFFFILALHALHEYWGLF